MDQKKSSAQFLKNRDEWIRWVVNNPELDHSVSRVGVSLAMRMRGDQQYCWPSIDTIHKDTGVSRRAISNALDVLAGGVDDKTGEDRQVYIFRQSRPNVGNIYALNFPWA